MSINFQNHFFPALEAAEHFLLKEIENTTNYHIHLDKNKLDKHCRSFTSIESIQDHSNIFATAHLFFNDMDLSKNTETATQLEPSCYETDNFYVSSIFRDYIISSCLAHLARKNTEDKQCFDLATSFAFTISNRHCLLRDLSCNSTLYSLASVSYDACMAAQGADAMKAEEALAVAIETCQTANVEINVDDVGNQAFLSMLHLQDIEKATSNRQLFNEPWPTT